MFELRVNELKQRRFFRECTLETTPQNKIVGKCPDEESLIAYLTVVRQFMLEKSPIELRGIRHILHQIGKRISVNIPIPIGKATVIPGGVVLGRDGGVIFIPPQLAEQVDHLPVANEQVEEILKRRQK